MYSAMKEYMETERVDFHDTKSHVSRNVRRGFEVDHETHKQFNGDARKRSARHSSFVLLLKACSFIRCLWHLQLQVSSCRGTPLS